MRLCLTCRYLSPSKTLYCAHCARSFGGRRCALRHLSPPHAVCCVQCGRTELSEATASVNLGGAVGLVVWAGALVFLAFLWRYGAGMGRVALEAAYWFLAILFPVDSDTLWRGVERAVVWIVVAFVLLQLIPGQIGQGLRRGIGRSLRSLWRTLGRLVNFLVLFRLLRGFVTGNGRIRP